MRSPDYLRWIRSLRCSVSKCKAHHSDACHSGAHALSVKASDLATIPLCRRHHQEFDASPRRFAARYRIDVAALVESLNEIGLAGLRLHRPARRVESPQFIRTRCLCGWQSSWFRILRDAQGALHGHLADMEKAA
jgi:hypothetical protein